MCVCVYVSPNTQAKRTRIKTDGGSETGVALPRHCTAGYPSENRANASPRGTDRGRGQHCHSLASDSGEAPPGRGAGGCHIGTVPLVTNKTCPHLGPRIRQHRWDPAISYAGWSLLFPQALVRRTPQAFSIPNLEALCQIRDYRNKSSMEGSCLELWTVPHPEVLRGCYLHQGQCQPQS